MESQVGGSAAQGVVLEVVTPYVVSVFMQLLLCVYVCMCVT